MTIYELNNMTAKQVSDAFRKLRESSIRLYGTKEEYKNLCERQEFHAVLDRFEFVEWTGGVNE